jgi:RNA polymerase sigma-70 factor (ECF subfamily)
MSGGVDGGTGVSDADLVLRFQGGEEAAFETLLRRYMREAYGFCLRLTRDAEKAEELSQQGFVRAYRALRRFRGEATFRSWLYQIFVNLYRDWKRRSRREEVRLEAVREAVARRQEMNLQESSRDASDLEEVVKGRVALLPDRQREVLVLHLYQGLAYAEIAAALGCSYDDVKMNLSLARKKLKQELKGYL